MILRRIIIGVNAYIKKEKIVKLIDDTLKYKKEQITESKQGDKNND